MKRKTATDWLLNGHTLIYWAVLRNQEQQGNKTNPSMDIESARSNGNFAWLNSNEGEHVWASLYNRKDVIPFYEYYNKDNRLNILYDYMKSKGIAGHYYHYIDEVQKHLGLKGSKKKKILTV